MALVAVLEVRRANAGRDPFPLFLKRGKVYKNLDSYLNIDAPTTHTTQLIDRTGRVDPATMETFTEADFAVGREVKINGATFLIYGCDEFTREMNRLRMEGSASIEAARSEIKRIERELDTLLNLILCHMTFDPLHLGGAWPSYPDGPPKVLPPVPVLKDAPGFAARALFI